VNLTEGDVVALATGLGMGEDEFIGQYTRLNQNQTGLALIDHEDDSCIFLEGNDCVVNDFKPTQCRGFPNEWNFPGWQDECEAIPV